MQYVAIGLTNTTLSFNEQRVLNCNGGQRKSKAFSPLISVHATLLISMLKRMCVYVLCFLEDNLYLQQPTKYKWTSLLLLLNTCWCWSRCVTSKGKMKREIVGQSCLPKSWKTWEGDQALTGQFENGKNTRKRNLQKAPLIKSLQRCLQWWKRLVCASPLLSYVATRHRHTQYDNNNIVCLFL